jgi:hypothetical protein
LIWYRSSKKQITIIFLSNNVVEKRKLYVRDNKNKTMNIGESEEKNGEQKDIHKKCDGRQL